MYKTLAITVFIFGTIFSCKSTSRTSASEVRDRPSQDTEGMIFVGCGPSVGECQQSCPERNGRGLTDTPECRDDNTAPIACYCPTGSTPNRPEVDLSKFYFAACVLNGAECKHSCSNKTIYFQPFDKHCASEGPESSQNGCYCSK
jgi:hypothetical protein